MKGIFITSTGTEIGKTHVAAEIIRQRVALGLPVFPIKPVISGVDEQNWGESDTVRLIDALGTPPTADLIERVSPIRYIAPLAPQMAAEAEGKIFDADVVITHTKKTLETEPFTLVEGVGGAHVPLDDKRLIADWITAVKLPIILVTGSYLGTMSHTISSVEALNSRGIHIQGIIISETAPLTDGGTHPDLYHTREAIAEHVPCPIVALPRNATQIDLLKPFGLDHG